jgi:hypothetical protein
MIPEPDSADRFVDQPHAAIGNTGAPALQLGAYAGPLDLLLELARAQRVDLAQLSITALAEQFAAVVEAALARRTVPLPRLAEWLIMAAWLVALRARLLLPAETNENVAARREADGLWRRLADRAAALRLADWLERRLQLGRDVFGRGVAEPAAGAVPLADITDCCGPASSYWRCRRASGSTGRTRHRSGGCRRRWTACAGCCRACPTARRWRISCRRQSRGLPPRCSVGRRWPAPSWPGWS